MKNIMKSILYEVICNKLLIRIYLFFFLVMGLLAVLNLGVSVHPGHTSEMLADDPVMTYEFPIFILAMIVGVICGSDYKDKVANYEIMAGHSRLSVFLARSLMAILLGAVAALILCFIPMIVGIIVDGWGSTLVLKDVIVRQLLFFFPLLRLAAFFAMLTFLIKNQYIMLAVGFIVAGSITIFDMIIDHSKSIFISLFNLGLLTDYKGWSIYNVDPAQGVVTYSSYVSSLPQNVIIGTIIASLIMTLFYLVMGYALFRRDELN